MAMAGISPQILMKSAYRSVMFFIGHKELEMQFKLNNIVGQCRPKCEAMQPKFTEKLEQVHTAYQKIARRCKMLENETESLSKDKQELQKKFSEKSRQKRKLDEMYDQLRREYEMIKQSAIQTANNFFTRAELDLFSRPDNLMDNRRDICRQDWLVFLPTFQGQRKTYGLQQDQRTPTATHLMFLVDHLQIRQNCLVVMSTKELHILSLQLVQAILL